MSRDRIEVPERKSLIVPAPDQEQAIGYLLGILEDARTTTLERIRDVSDEELDWLYAPGWNTIGALLSHIVAIENLFRIVRVEERSLTEAEAARWNPGIELGDWVSTLRGKGLEKYDRELAASRAAMLEALEQLPSEKFFERRDPKGNWDEYNLAWVLYHQSEEEVHHRGQISILRKLYAEQMKK